MMDYLCACLDGIASFLFQAYPWVQGNAYSQMRDRPLHGRWTTVGGKMGPLTEAASQQQQPDAENGDRR